MKKFLLVSDDEKTVSINNPELQKSIDRKGFSALACSEDYSPKEVLDLYDLRDASEKQFMILKSQLGYHTGRGHFDQGIEARHFIAFIAGIIRNEMRLICKETNLDLGTILRELDLITIERLGSGSYRAIRCLNDRQKKFLEGLGLEAEDLEFFADLETQYACGKVCDQNCRLPETMLRTVKAKEISFNDEEYKSDMATAESEYDTQGQKKKGKPGRKAGSKNVRTDLDDIVDAIMAEEDRRKKQEKKGPGRRTGSKNKTPEQRAAEAAVEKKGRGRRPGSKNRRTIIKEKLMADPSYATKYFENREYN